MTTYWHQTDLSVSPPSFELGSADTVALAFDAEQAVTGASAKLIRLDTLADVTVASVQGTTLNGTVATVTVTGLVRDVTYELDVTFAAVGNVGWTRSLVLECVA